MLTHISVCAHRINAFKSGSLPTCWQCDNEMMLQHFMFVLCSVQYILYHSEIKSLHIEISIFLSRCKLDEMMDTSLIVYLFIDCGVWARGLWAEGVRCPGSVHGARMAIWNTERFSFGVWYPAHKTGRRASFPLITSLSHSPFWLSALIKHCNSPPPKKKGAKMDKKTKKEAWRHCLPKKDTHFRQMLLNVQNVLIRLLQDLLRHLWLRARMEGEEDTR